MFAIVFAAVDGIEGFAIEMPTVMQNWLKKISDVRFGQPNRLLRYADKRIVNIMRVYIERNNLQLELIRYCKKC